MNEKENQKIDELSQRLEAIDQQEAQNHPMTGTRRWFFRALTFGIGGAVLGKSFIAEASSTCGIENETCVYDECTIDKTWMHLINNCHKIEYRYLGITVSYFVDWVVGVLEEEEGITSHYIE